ncbi:putative F-box protein At1g19160 [Lolium perenne]|uniref:putative F-box protein At1g19160 n=1 Tax=Lolium perenne TaxID=4522 RepID=UPI0021EA93C5|nr:uncharacterized protein LOC127317758 [Lolium perenne]
MSDRRRATQFEDLPEEIIVDQILIRLLSKDVGRYRAVNTSWHHATSTPQFMLEHRRRQPLLPIIDGQRKPSSYAVYTGAGASGQQLWPFLPGSKTRYNALFASCDGLLIVNYGPRLYICNPVIRRHALLPLLVYGQGFVNIVIGFYRHHPTKDYRVLLVSQNYPKYSLHNLTVGSDESRHIKVTMPAVSLPSVEQKLLNRLTDLRHCPPPVQHRGNLHWCPYGARDITEGGGDIIVFDTEAESFRWVRSPGQLCYNRKLFDMKGTLAFWGGSAPDFITINVWVMQDYEAEIWAFKCRIDLSTVDSSRRLYTTSLKKKRKKKTPLDSTVTLFNDMVVLNDRELLIKFNGKHVLRCDIDGKFLGIVNLGTCQYQISLTQHRFQESIVPIPYHGMQEEDEESPFYTGHV